MFYLATSPHFSPKICTHLGAAGLNGPQVRVVLEKPLGHDLASASDINGVVRSVFREEQALHIEIKLAEQIGFGMRGDFYDRTGALRDMIQNHALQLLMMIAMEPPSRNDANAIRDEKLKVLHALKPFTADSVRRDV